MDIGNPSIAGLRRPRGSNIKIAERSLRHHDAKLHCDGHKMSMNPRVRCDDECILNMCNDSVPRLVYPSLVDPRYVVP
jgi:hypothetical protein